MKVFVHPDYAYLQSFVDEIPYIFDREDKGTILHQGRNTVKLYEVEGTQLVVKHFKKPNFIQRFVYTFFKPSKAERAYKYAEIFRANNILTPHEVAYIEIKKNGFLNDSYFISLNCDWPSMKEYDKPVKHDFDSVLFHQLVLFLIELHKKNIFHGDTNLSNFLYQRNEADQITFCLIDTNRSKFMKPTLKRCIKNMVRITHHRDLYCYIIIHYANLRGWDSDECIIKAFHLLDKFERKNKIKRTLKGRK